jgi:hypothetical protein
VTDISYRNGPPPSPHWKPNAVASRPRVSPTFGADRLRPDARSLAVPGALAMVLLTIQIVGTLAIGVALIVNKGYWSEANELAQRTSSSTVFETMTHRYSGVYGFLTAVMIMLAINSVLFFGTFVWWFQRAYRNLVKREIHPAWAYVGWFVPIVSLWKPKQIANRIWRKTFTERLGGAIQWWWFGPYVLLLSYPLSYALLMIGGANGDYEVIGIVAGGLLLLQATVPMALFVMIRAVTRGQTPLIVAARQHAESVRLEQQRSAPIRTTADVGPRTPGPPA